MTGKANLLRAGQLVFRLLPAVILLQTLYFKFTSSEESVYIFTTMGMEPWGRYLTGAAELVAAILLLIPRTTLIGSLLALAIMGGAIGGHLTVLGIEVRGDGGLLFGMALVVTLCSLANAWLYRKRLLTKH